MPNYLILKLNGDDLPEVVDLIDSADDADQADEIKRGYQSDGRYAIVDWDARLEADLALGPVEAAEVEDPAARAAKAAPDSDALALS